MNRKIYGLSLLFLSYVFGIAAMQEPVVLASATMEKPMVLASTTMNDYELTKIIYHQTNYFTHIPDDLKNMIFCVTQAELLREKLYMLTPYTIVKHPNPLIAHATVLYKWALQCSPLNYNLRRLKMFPGRYLVKQLEHEDDKNALQMINDVTLVNAIERNNPTLFAYALARGANPNAVVKGKTPLSFAVSANNPSMIRDLLANKADVNFQMYTGDSVFHQAAILNSIDCVDALLTANPNVDVRSVCNVTPIMIAIINKNQALFERLLSHGANPNQAPFNTPLLCKAVIARLDIAPLLAAGADPNALSGNKYSPLCYAAKIGNLDACQKLLAAGANPDITCNDMTAEEIARESGHGGIVALLEQHKREKENQQKRTAQEAELKQRSPKRVAQDQDSCQ